MKQALCSLEAKVLELDEMLLERRQLKQDERRLVFTNGCFDVLHVGHAAYLSFARRQGDALLVGLNSDESVRRLKGPTRPVNNQRDRALLLAALKVVDYVIIFDEDEPAEIIDKLLPDVLVKGEDWAHYVSGREAVERQGGRVVLAPLMHDKSTTGTLRRIRAMDQEET